MGLQSENLLQNNLMFFWNRLIRDDIKYNDEAFGQKDNGYR